MDYRCEAFCAAWLDTETTDHNCSLKGMIAFAMKCMIDILDVT